MDNENTGAAATQDSTTTATVERTPVAHTDPETRLREILRSIRPIGGLTDLVDEMSDCIDQIVGPTK